MCILGSGGRDLGFLMGGSVMVLSVDHGFSRRQIGGGFGLEKVKEEDEGDLVDTSS